jgi:hypothetical protein
MGKPSVEYRCRLPLDLPIALPVAGCWLPDLCIFTV